VICFGNPLHGDDGFGQHVLQRLRARGIDAVDGGTAGLNALSHFDGCAKVIVVDAVRTGDPVGTVHRLTQLAPPGGEFSLHELGVASLLAALPDPPEVVVIGAEVGEIQPFTDRLSAPLETAVPAAVRLVEAEFERGPRPTGHSVQSDVPLGTP
jgi:hydrogenase maturation protease